MGKYSIRRGYKRKKRYPVIIASLLLIAGALIVSSNRNFQAKQDLKGGASLSSDGQISSPDVIKDKLSLTDPLPWPSYGQAAYGASNAGVLAKSTNKPTPVPIASLAKVITALAILEKKPLRVGEQGPTITLTDQDIAFYEEHVAKDGSVVPIEVGEQITQYQAMQAMLLPSANNISDSLAVWAFGSKENYVQYANHMLAELGLSNTKVADPSGYSPKTVSTAPELVKLGILYMNNPVLREIAQQPEATIPFAGQIINYNAGINKDGIIGIKVGYTDEAGRTFLVADVRDGKKISVAAVLGADNFPTAMHDAANILQSGNFGLDRLP